MKKTHPHTKRRSKAAHNPMALAMNRVAVLSHRHQDNLLSIMEGALQALHDRTLDSVDWDNLTQAINIGLQLAERCGICSDEASTATLRSGSKALGAVAKRLNDGLGCAVFPDELHAVDLAVELVTVQLANTTVRDLEAAIKGVAKLKADARAGRIDSISLKPTEQERATA